MERKKERKKDEYFNGRKKERKKEKRSKQSEVFKNLNIRISFM